MKEITVLSPAKLNLYLDVLDKRTDGYHNIQTIFEKIDLCDEITIRKKSRGIEIKCDFEPLPLGRDNLIYKAIEKLSELTGKSLGVRIFIKKRIPISSGLGGGSSNAASVITAVLDLYDLELNRESIFGIARSLGADIAFFLTDFTYAIGRGIGDELERVESGLVLWQVLIRPRQFISTAKMYENLKISNTNGLTGRDLGVKLLKKAIEDSDIISVGRNCYNIFENILLKEEILVKKAKKLLYESGSIGTCLSGSGPTVFGIFRDRGEAIALKKNLKLQDLDWDIFVVRSYGG